MAVTRNADGLHLAVEVDGHGAHPAAGSAGGSSPAVDITLLATQVAIAERAGFALVTIDDGPTIDSDAPSKEQTDAGHTEPGRGWRIEAGVRAAFLSRRTSRIGVAPTLHVTVTEPFVARRLWDSWQDDAVIRDRATGRFLYSDRVHHVDFTGARFSVVGPLITPRPPQGLVVVLYPAPPNRYARA